MARKPLINIEDSNFKRCGSPAYSMLISGNMTPVKDKVLKTVLHKKNVPALVINLDNTSPYIISSESYYDYSLYGDSGYDVFSSMSVREACIYLQNVAYKKNYSDEQTIQIIRYLQFIEKLNSYLGVVLPTIRDINTFYYDPDVIGERITKMFQAGEISPTEYKHLNVSLIRAIKGQLIIDNLLASTDFNLNYNSYSNFSVSNIRSGQTALIDLSTKHNSHTETKNREDILYSIEECRNDMAIVLNVGKSDYNIVSDFVKNMTTRKNCQFLVIIDDIFSQSQQYDTVRRYFSFNMLGQHTGESCRKMSECFHEVYKQETHYARTVDSRLLSDSFIDILFHTNHTDTTTTVLVKRSVIEQHDIANLSECAFVLLDNTGTTNYFSIYSI